ncbi:hypothetical protein, partial [Vibrio sp. TRT 1302]|uniref:hypothetical protein n=1 Tax=Vibrio sp. TRT 1302 TaxID=3418504 RepID=UPI003CE731ED
YNVQTPKMTKGRYKATFLCMVPVGGLIGQAFLPPPRRQRLNDSYNVQTPKMTKGRYKATFLCMVPVGGLEPPRPKATDFELTAD